jgi:hypothetical protein
VAKKTRKDDDTLMTLPELPDLSTAVAMMAKYPPIKLAAGEKFTAQIDSVVMPVEMQKLVGTLLVAFAKYIPESLLMAEEALGAMLEPMTAAELEEARVMMDKVRPVRELYQRKFEEAFGGKAK